MLPSPARPSRCVSSPVTPCRVVDTRNPNGTFGGPAISGGTSRSFPLPQGGCGIPATATAYALNVTVVPHRHAELPDHLADRPAPARGLDAELLDGRIKANAAIIPAGTSGAVSVYVTDTTDVILDITGYFTTGNSSALAFFPLTPCRVADTRGANGPLGGPMLQQNQQRDFPVLASACGIPSTAQAYSFNFTVVPQSGHALGYLTVWPTGQAQPVVSTLNAPTGTNIANAAIVPAGTGGDIEAYAYGNDTDLIIDINGYFARSQLRRQSDVALQPHALPRARHTSVAAAAALQRRDHGQRRRQSLRRPRQRHRLCPERDRRPSGPLGYLTLWPDGRSQPVVSTLNAVDGAITSNMAIVPTINGFIDAYAPNPTNLILDISGYFAP